MLIDVRSSSPKPSQWSVSSAGWIADSCGTASSNAEKHGDADGAGHRGDGVLGQCRDEQPTGREGEQRDGDVDDDAERAQQAVAE